MVGTSFFDRMIMNRRLREQPTLIQDPAREPENLQIEQEFEDRTLNMFLSRGEYEHIDTPTGTPRQELEDHARDELQPPLTAPVKPMAIEHEAPPLPEEEEFVATPPTPEEAISIRFVKEELPLDDFDQFVAKHSKSFKKCAFFFEKGWCRYGLKCKHSHIVENELPRPIASGLIGARKPVIRILDSPPPVKAPAIRIVNSPPPAKAHAAVKASIVIRAPIKVVPPPPKVVPAKYLIIQSPRVIAPVGNLRPAKRAAVSDLKAPPAKAARRDLEASFAREVVPKLLQGFMRRHPKETAACIASFVHKKGSGK